MLNEAEKFNLGLLILRSIEGEITQEEFDVLNRQIIDSDAVRRYYCKYISAYSALQRTDISYYAGDDDKHIDYVFDSDFWQAMADYEKSATEVHLAPSREPSKSVVVEKVDYGNAKYIHFNRRSFWSLIAAAAAVLFLVIFARFAPSRSGIEVATLSDSLNAQWVDTNTSMQPGRRLATGSQHYYLREGYVQIKLDNKTQITLEGPSEFQFLTGDAIKLNFGKLYAIVPPEAYGFMVSTPSAKIIDLGTEFGVQQELNGDIVLHVVKGKANLVSGINNSQINASVEAGSAKRLDGSTGQLNEMAINERLFVRRVDSANHSLWNGQPLDLADIVGGGNGFGTGRPDQGIDASSGRAVRSLTTLDVFSGAKGYFDVPSSPYIDGVFVPGIEIDTTRISSRGMQADFPKTSGRLWGYIFNGAWHQGSDDVPRHALQLNGIPIDGKRIPAVTIHSNMGITFDLSAIRKTLSGMEIDSFSSTFGVSETVEKWLSQKNFSDLAPTPDIEKLKAKRQASVEVWVFLDGKLAFRRTISSSSKAGSVDIPIEDGVRFLTLAVTEADDTLMFDWALFARPQLVLKAADQ